jgi:hypothetical protein
MLQGIFAEIAGRCGVNQSNTKVRLVTEPELPNNSLHLLKVVTISQPERV